MPTIFSPYLKTLLRKDHHCVALFYYCEIQQAEVAEQEAVCYLRNVHMSPFKVRRVLDCIRGKSYEECLIMLELLCQSVLTDFVGVVLRRE